MQWELQNILNSCYFSGSHVITKLIDNFILYKLSGNIIL